MSSWCFIYWILCGLLPRIYHCESTGQWNVFTDAGSFTIKELSGDGRLYLPATNSTFSSFSFTLSENCSIVLVDLWNGTHSEKFCQYTPTKVSGNCSHDADVYTVPGVPRDRHEQMVILKAEGCKGQKVEPYNFSITVMERPTLLNLTADIQGPEPAVQGDLTVDEDSAVTVRCRWNPGHPPRNATLSRNGTPLPPSRLVTLSPPLEGAGKEEKEGEGEGEAVNLVEHTVQSFGRQHSGLYACQVEEGGGRRNLTLWIRARSDRNGGLSVVAVSASLSSTVFVSVLLALCILCSRRRKRKMMGKCNRSGRMTRQRYRESWALAAYRQTPEEEGNMIINTLYEGGPASGQTTKVPVDVLGYSEVQDRVGQASDAAGRVDKGTMLFPSEVDGRYHDINDPRYENPPPPRPHHQLHQPHPHGVRG